MIHIFRFDKNLGAALKPPTLRTRNGISVYAIHMYNVTFEPKFNAQDLLLVEKLVETLKALDGDWSQNGLQRMVRLKSECTQEFVSLRSSGISADVPQEQVSSDPFSKNKKI